MDPEATLADPEDALFVKVLLHNELAGEDQVGAAIELHRRSQETGGRVRIAEILLHQGAIDTRTLDSVVNLQRARFPDLPHPLALRRKGLTPERDRAVAEAAVAQNVVTQEKLDRARGVQEKLRALGFDRRVCEVLWIDRDLDEPTVERLLHEEKRRARQDGDATRRLRSRVQVGPVSDAELLFGKYAVKNGFLTEEALTQVMDTQRQCRELGVVLKLAEVMHHRKLLTEENVAQIAELMSMEREQFLPASFNRTMLRRLDDTALLASLQERGFLTAEQADQTRQVQGQLKALGIERRAGEVLLDLKLVSNEVVYAVLDEQLRARLRAALQAAEKRVEAAPATPTPPAVVAAAAPPPAPAPTAAAPAEAPVDSRQALRQVMIEALRAAPPPPQKPATRPSPVLAVAALLVAAVSLLWWSLRDPSAGRPTSTPGPSPGTGPGPHPVATNSAPAAGALPPAGPGADPYATAAVVNVEQETQEAVQAAHERSKQEEAEWLRRARALLADADPEELEVALVISRTPDGVVFDVYGQAPLPDDLPVQTALSFYGVPIPEASKAVPVRNRLFHARTGPLSAHRRPPAGLYTATADFTASFALGSEEAIRAAGVPERLAAAHSSALGSPEEEQSESEAEHALQAENLARVEAFEAQSRIALDADPTAGSIDEWPGRLNEWRAALQQVRAGLEESARGALATRHPEGAEAVLALLPPADKAMRAIATSVLGAHGIPIPDDLQLKNLRPGEAVIPQEHLARLSEALARARESLARAWSGDLAAEFLRRSLARRAATAESLFGDLDQTLRILEEGAVTHGGGIESSSPVSWLRRWLGQVKIERKADRGLLEQPAHAPFADAQARLDEVLGFLAELGKVRFAAALHEPTRSLPSELRPLGAASEPQLRSAIRTGLDELIRRLGVPAEPR